jgi:transposase
VLHYFVLYRPTVLQLCRHFGISRSTFHRWVERFNPADPLSLLDKSHDGRTGHPPKLSPEAIELIRHYRLEAPLLGKERIATLLREEHGITVSPSTVARMIERECLYFGETPLHWKKRVENGREEWTLPHASAESLQTVPVDHDQSVVTQTAPTSVVHLHMPEKAEPGMLFSGVVKSIVIASLLTNIIFISMLIGIALFERSTKVASPQTNSVTAQTAGGQGSALHGAPSSILLSE